MIGAGLFPEDIVVVRRQSVAENGQMVVAAVGDEATVKWFYRRGNRIELRPDNPDFEVIVPSPGEFRLLGKVIEVHRYLEAPPLIAAH
jgi:repressor LexA